MSPPAASCFVRLAASSRHASRPADPQSTPISPFKSLFRNSNRTPAATEPLRPAQRGSGRRRVALGGVSRVGGDVVTARPHAPRHLAVVRKRLATSLPRRRETGNKFQPLTCRRHPDLTYTRSPIRIGRLFFLYVSGRKACRCCSWSRMPSWPCRLLTGATSWRPGRLLEGTGQALLENDEVQRAYLG